MTDRPDLLLVCAVEREAMPLLRLGQLLGDEKHPGLSGWRARFGGRVALIAAGGMGYTNAAQALTHLISVHGPRPTVGFGVAGAPKDAGASLEDVVIADTVSYGDVGVETESGWIGARGIGIPLGEGSGGPFFDSLACDANFVDTLASLAEAHSIPAVTGPVVSASTGSGSAAAQLRLRSRSPGLAEEMEGAALAHVAALYGCPFALVRGISNWSGERNLAAWRIDPAAENVARLLARFIREATLP